MKHKQKSCKHDDDRQWAVTTPFLRKYYEENQNTINPRADVYLPCPAPGILWRTWGDIVQNEPAVKEHLLKAPPIKTIKHKELPRAPGTDFIGMNLGHRRNDAGMAVTDKGEVARPSTNEQSDKNDEPEESRKRKRETDESTEAPLPKKRARRKIRKRYW